VGGFAGGASVGVVVLGELDWGSGSGAVVVPWRGWRCGCGEERRGTVEWGQSVGVGAREGVGGLVGVRVKREVDRLKE